MELQQPFSPTMAHTCKSRTGPTGLSNLEGLLLNQATEGLEGPVGFLTPGARGVSGGLACGGLWQPEGWLLWLGCGRQWGTRGKATTLFNNVSNGCWELWGFNNPAGYHSTFANALGPPCSKNDREVVTDIRSEGLAAPAKSQGGL